MKLVSKEPSKWCEEAQWRIDNRPWLKVSQHISIKILVQIDEQKVSRSELAEKLEITVDFFENMLHGKYNFTIREIVKLEEILNIKLIEIQ
jgi:ribosome-binding protein aMBF1 (putative translation factor)